MVFNFVAGEITVGSTVFGLASHWSRLAFHEGVALGGTSNKLFVVRSTNNNTTICMHRHMLMYPSMYLF